MHCCLESPLYRKQASLRESCKRQEGKMNNVSACKPADRCYSSCAELQSTSPVEICKNICWLICRSQWVLAFLKLYAGLRIIHSERKHAQLSNQMSRQMFLILFMETPCMKNVNCQLYEKAVAGTHTASIGSEP